MNQRFFVLLLLPIYFALALTTSAQSVYTPYTITTLAGKAGASGTNNGTRSAARFNAPSDVSVDGAGNVYVADTYNYTIRKVTPAGVVTTLAGAGFPGTNDGTGVDAKFWLPVGVGADSAGNVYVVDADTIRQVTPAGVVTTLAGSPLQAGTNDGVGSAARFRDPFGVTADGAGNVYVADTGNYTIRKLSPVATNWVVTTLAGLAGHRGSTDGTGSAARFGIPVDVAADGAGNVYVADLTYYDIRRVTPAGVVTTLAGLAGNSGSADGTGSAARFGQPSGIALDGAGNIYVADSGNSVIRKVTPAGMNWVVTTLAGAAFNEYLDGTGSAARFYQPFDVAADSAGNIYVVDSHNNTVRVGNPESAPAVIVTTTPALGFRAGQFGFPLTGPAGQLAVVEVSTDLVSWLPVWTNTFPGIGTNQGRLTFLDPQSGAFPQSFYRVLTP